LAFNKGPAFSRIRFDRDGRKLEKMSPEVRGQAARHLARALDVAAGGLGRTRDAGQVVRVAIAEAQRPARGLLM
jgi:hypothetical protein